MQPPTRIRVIRLIPVLDFGGVESIFVQWGQLVDRERYDPRICTLSKAGAAAAELRGLGVAVDCLERDPSVREPRTTLALRAYLQRTQPDVLHCAISEATWHGTWAGRMARVPRIVVEETGIPARSPLGRVAFGACFRAADAVIGVSEATCEYLRRQERVPASRIHLVHNCAAPRFFEPLAREAPRSDRLRVLAVGRLDPVKNFEGLVRAFRTAVDAFPGAHLDIAGDGPARADLQALVRALALEDHVSLLGFRADVRELHARADLFVLPSHSEGMSVALIEAMASGLPVLASNRGGNPEVLAGLGDSVLLDPNDHDAWARAILRIGRLSPANRVEEGQRSRAIARERFSPSRHMEALDALYGGGAPGAGLGRRRGAVPATASRSSR